MRGPRPPTRWGQGGAGAAGPWNACSPLENAAFLGGATYLAGASLLEVTSGVLASRGQAGCVCIPRCAGAVCLETDGWLVAEVLRFGCHPGTPLLMTLGELERDWNAWGYAVLVLAASRAWGLTRGPSVADTLGAGRGGGCWA